MPRSRLAIGAVPLGVDRELRVHLDQQRQAILELAGASGSGDPLMRAVRVQDLITAEVVLRPPVISGGFANILPNPVPEVITPPQPTSLSAAGAFSAIILSWDAPTYDGHAYAEVLRSTTSVFANAEVIGIALSGVYQDYVPDNQTYYYWLRYVSTSNIRGVASAPDSAAAAIAADVVTDGLDLVALLDNEYSVKIDRNGYITGYGLAVTGDPYGTPSSVFAVLADTFVIGFPSHKWLATTAYSLGQYVIPTDLTDNNLVYEVTVAGTSGSSEPSWPTIVGNTVANGSVTFTCRSQASTIPFIVGMVDGVKTVGVSGNLVVDGTILARHIAAATITADKLSVSNLAAITANMGSITAGDITISTSGFIKGGATAYLTGTGFFLGYSGAAYKFSVGNPSTKYMAWDGTDLIIQGNIVDLGATDYQAGTTAIAVANTERQSSGDETVWDTVKQFRLRRKGTVKVALERKRTTFSIVSWDVQPAYRIRQAGTTLHTQSFTETSYTAATHDVTVTSPNDGDIYIDVKTGKGDTAEPATEYPDAYVKNCQIQVSNPYGEGAIVD